MHTLATQRAAGSANGVAAHHLADWSNTTSMRDNSLAPDAILRCKARTAIVSSRSEAFGPHRQVGGTVRDSFGPSNQLDIDEKSNLPL